MEIFLLICGMQFVVGVVEVVGCDVWVVFGVVLCCVLSSVSRSVTLASTSSPSTQRSSVAGFSSPHVFC